MMVLIPGLKGGYSYNHLSIRTNREQHKQKVKKKKQRKMKIVADHDDSYMASEPGV